MFSGIVEEQGSIVRIRQSSRVWELEVACTLAREGTKTGESISVNGVCLTVVAVGKTSLTFEVMAETRQSTTLQFAAAGMRVNLERALRVHDRIGGHFVSGHVDCIGVITSKRLLRGNLVLEISVPPAYLKWCVDRGSVAIDGVSLTVMERRASALRVYLIPHTAQQTVLGAKTPSQRVNVEFDMLVKSSR
jgi:riboflavin synthase